MRSTINPTAGRYGVKTIPRLGRLWSSNIQIKVIRDFLLAIAVACSLIQVAFFGSEEGNIISTLLALISSTAAIMYSLQPRLLEKYPISSMMILSFNFSSISGALIFKTVELSALVEYLMNPMTTFGALAVVQFTLILSHAAYRRLGFMRFIRNMLATRILLPFKVFKIPSVRQCWLMGLIGLISIVASRLNMHGYGNQFSNSSILDKFLEGFNFLALTPFLIPFLGHIDKDSKVEKGSYLGVGVYFLILLALGIMLNTRSLFFDGLATIGTVVFLFMGTGKIRVKFSTLAKTIIVLLVAVPVFSFLSDLSTAMVMVRGNRSDVSGVELFKETLDALQDRDSLSAFEKMNNVLLTGEYNENYLNGPLLKRLIITKYHDNMFHYIDDFPQDGSSKLRGDITEKVLAIFPSPFLDVFGIELDKKQLGFSSGDYIYYIAHGVGLGGHRVGSMVAEGFALAGFLFPIVLFMGAFFVYAIYDAFTIFKPGVIVFSPLILVNSWYLLGGSAGITFSAESVSNLIGGLIRGVPQLVLLYFIVYKITGFFSLRRRRIN